MSINECAEGAEEMTPDWMPPPLPEYASFACDKFGEGLGCLFTTEQMHAYARAAVESYKRSLKPVAYMNTESPYSILSLVPWAGSPHNVPLYRLDGGDDANAA